MILIIEIIVWAQTRRMSSCCNCCGFVSLIGVVFFGITATMVQRKNTVFLTHKAGVDPHDIHSDDVIHTKFIMMIYMSLVSTRSES